MGVYLTQRVYFCVLIQQKKKKKNWERVMKMTGVMLLLVQVDMSILLHNIMPSKSTKHIYMLSHKSLRDGFGDFHFFFFFGIPNNGYNRLRHVVKKKKFYAKTMTTGCCFQKHCILVSFNTKDNGHLLLFSECRLDTSVLRPTTITEFDYI